MFVCVFVCVCASNKSITLLILTALPSTGVFPSLAKDCEIENKQLRETLKEYNSEFAQVKNQGMYARWKS